MVKNYNQTVNELSSKAINYYNSGDLDNAAIYFEKLFVYDPYDKDTYYNLAKAYYEMSDYQKCIKLLLGLIKLGDEGDTTFILLGDTYAKIEKYSDALLCYKRVSDNDFIKSKIKEIKELVQAKEDKLYMQYMNYPYPNIWHEQGIPDTHYSLVNKTGSIRRISFYETQYLDINYIQLKYWDDYKDLKKVRVLNAGCGTGEGLVQMAFLYPEVEFVAVDISGESLKYAKESANKLRVTNIEFHTQDITKISPKDYGYFDIVVSTGVLHHLYSPIDGIRKLKDVLKEDGILGGLIYATIGRREVYDFRDIFREMFTETELMEDKIKVARGLIASLNTWQSLNRIKLMPDINYEGNQGLVDLLLNANETSYTTTELRELFNSADMNIHFSSNKYLDPLFIFYNIQEDDVRNRLLLLDNDIKIKIAEILNGCIFKHNFLTYKKSYKPSNNDIFDKNFFDMYPIMWHGAFVTEKNNEYYVDLRHRCENTDIISRYIVVEDGNSKYLKYPLVKKEYDFLRQCNGKKTINEILKGINEEFELKDLKRLLFDLYRDDVLFIKKNKQVNYNG